MQFFSIYAVQIRSWS